VKGLSGEDSEPASVLDNLPHLLAMIRTRMQRRNMNKSVIAKTKSAPSLLHRNFRNRRGCFSEDRDKKR
jgi:hypothetical protein